VVGEGRVKVFKLSEDGKEQVLHLIGPGQSFAEATIFEGGTYPAHAEALSGCDLVLIEGYKSLPLPKIEVTRSGVARPPVEGISGRVSDRPAEDGVPTFAFGDREGILRLVLRLAGLDRSPSS
jgi:molybdopterin-guanine dinucleotide biosynthesis protein